MGYYRQLALLLDARGRRQVAFLSAMMLVAAIFEAVGIGLIMPFIALVSSPERASDYVVLRYVSDAFGPMTNQELLTFAGVALLAVFVLKNAYLSLTYYVQYRIVFGQQVVLARRLFSAYLRNPYTYHLRRNSSELLRNLSEQIRRAFIFSVLPSLVIVIEGLVVVVVAALLVIVEPVVAPLSILGLGAVAGGFFYAIRRKVSSSGRELVQSSGDMIKWVQQGLGGLKEAKVLGREEYFLRRYDHSSDVYAGAIRLNSFVRALPRHVIETVAIGGLLLVLTLVVARGRDASSIVPIVGLFAMAAVRLMPSLTRIIGAMTQLRHNTPSVQVVLDDLREAEALLAAHDEQEVTEPALSLTKEIRFERVSFSFDDSDQPAIRDLSFFIERGQSVAIVGASGAGKTTVVNLLLGLLRPTRGSVLVDGRNIFENLPSWRRTIGYIPQPIYLCDASLRENVAFGVEPEDIDDEQVRRAVSMAQIEHLVQEMPQGLETEIGEEGVRISGGQRQRIGIARALYHDPEVLIFDEATSALDAKTELEVNRSIAALTGQKTVVVISHRLETVRHSDQILFLEKGQLVEAATYEQLLASNEKFRDLAQADRRPEQLL